MYFKYKKIYFKYKRIYLKYKRIYFKNKRKYLNTRNYILKIRECILNTTRTYILNAINEISITLLFVFDILQNNPNKFPANCLLKKKLMKQLFMF